MKPEQAFTNLANTIRKHGNPVCMETDPEIFFPEPSNGRDYSLVQAKKYCEGCHARVECAIFAIVNNEEYGVWGGLNVRTRQAIRSGHLTLREALEGKKLDYKVRADKRRVK